MAYSFDGADDWIRFGAGAFSGDAMRPGTYAILFKPTGRNGAWRGLLAVRTSAGAVRADLIELDTGDDWGFWNGQNGGNDLSGTVVANITSAVGDFVLCVLTWTSANAVRYHWKLGEAGAWNHGAIADTSGASTTFSSTDEWIVGNDPSLGDDFQGDVTIWGAKSGEALADATVESTFSTAFDGPGNWDSYFTGANTICHGFNSTGSLTDRTGNGGNETARSGGLGASLASDPTGWSWGGTAFSLDCQPGTYAVSGVAASVLAGRVVSADPGSYAVSGSAATLARGLFLTADPGAYALTGEAASPLAGRVVSADPGVFAVTGVAATTAAGRLFNAEPGSYTISGVAAEFVHGTPGAYTLGADPATYAVTGSAASPVAARLLALEPGSYTVSGSDATVGRTLTLDAAAAAYTLTGTDATLLRTAVLDATAGAYAVTGVAAELRPEGRAPNMDEILTGWIAKPVTGFHGGGNTGRLRTPTTGSIA